MESVKDKHKKVIALTVKPHPSYLLFNPFVKQSRQEFQGCLIQIGKDDKVEIKTMHIEEPKVNKLKLNIKCDFLKPNQKAYEEVGECACIGWDFVRLITLKYYYYEITRKME